MKIKGIKSVYKLSFCCLAICFCSISVQAQDNDIIKGGVEDATKVIDGYVGPFMKAMSLGLNQGWYNTGKTHKAWGFDLTLTVNAMTVPSSDRLYNIADLKLTNIELVPNQPEIKDNNVPTLFGPDFSPKYRPVNTTDPNLEFSGLPGLDLKKSIGMNAVPVPTLNLGFGLPKGIELKFRFTPKFDLNGKGNVQMYGLGVMHDIKQYIPGIKNLPFDLSVFAGYTHLILNYDMSGSVDGENPKAVFGINSTTIQGIISKKVSVITLYGALGYNIAKTNLDLKGTYVIKGETKTDPIALNYSASGPRVTAGVRLKLAVFTLHVDYTLQKYSCLSAGFGISVR